MSAANYRVFLLPHLELLCSYNDEDIYLFDATHSSESNYTHHYEGHRNSQTVKGVNFFGPHSEFVVSGSDCGHVFLWDKETEEIVQCQEGDFCGVVNCLEPHPFMPVLAISGLDSDPKIFTPTSETKSINDHVDEITEVNKTRRKEARDEMDFRDLLLLDFFSRNIRRGQIRRLIAEDADMSSEEDEELFFPLPNTRRRHHHEGDGEDEGDSNEDSTDDDSSHDDDDDDDGSSEEGGRRGRNVRVSCRQS
jgi:WD repeat-containing protein 42A